MAAVRPPKRVLPFVGMLSADPDLFSRARRHLERALGRIEAETEVWPFDFTSYYQAEMGPNLKRQFVSFTEPVRPERLPEIKRETNRIEDVIRDESLSDVPRPINLDPGYVTLSKVVLATTKDYSHRVYIDQGIYAEVTLHFEGRQWRAWPWTFPDYAADRYHPFFSAVRDRLKTLLAAATDTADAPPLDRPAADGAR